MYTQAKYPRSVEMVVIFARSWQQDNEPRSDTRYTTPSGSLSSTIHPWNPPPATSCYGTPVQTHPTLAEKNRRGERTKTERERRVKDWCLTVILNCKLIHRPFEINLYLEGEEDLQRASSKSIDTWPRFSIYFSLIFPDSHSRIFARWLMRRRGGPRGNKFRRCCARE